MGSVNIVNFTESHDIPYSRSDSLIIAVNVIEVRPHVVRYVCCGAHNHISAILGEQTALTVQLLLHGWNLPSSLWPLHLLAHIYCEFRLEREKY